MYNYIVVLPNGNKVEVIASSFAEALEGFGEVSICIREIK